MKVDRRRLHRYSNDLERMRMADSHLEQALTYLRKCSNSDPVLPFIAEIRQVRKGIGDVFEASLPRIPGSEPGGAKRDHSLKSKRVGFQGSGTRENRAEGN